MTALDAKRIVVTRAARQSAELADALRSAGAMPLRYPCLATAPPADMAPLDAALRSAEAGHFHWLLVTSANTVDALMSRGFDGSRVRCRYAAVGPATARALEVQLRVRATVVPANYRASSLADVLPLVPGERILLPQSDAADDSLADRLRRRGAAVTGVVAYRTIVGQGGVNLPELLRDGGVDMITVTSGSALRNLLARLRNEGGDEALVTRAPLACIGSETVSVVRACGLSPAVAPYQHTIPAMVAAIQSYFEARHVL